MKKIITILGLLISAIVLWYIIKNYDLQAAWETIKLTPIHIVLAMIMVYLFAFILRALRWKLMLADAHSKIKFTDLLKSIVIGFAGNNVLPARGGELVRMEFFSRKTKVSRVTAISSIGIEKILDALVLLVFISVISIFISKSNELISETIWLVSLILIPVFGALIGIRIFGAIIIKYLSSHSKPLFNKIADKFESIYASVLFFKLNLNVFKILALSVLIWLFEGAVFVIALHSMIDVGTQNVFLIGILALTVVNFAIIIPSSPGFIGVFQAAIVLALSSFAIDESQSLGVAILVHSCQFFPTTLLGLFVFLTNKSKNEKA